MTDFTIFTIVIENLGKIFSFERIFCIEQTLQPLKNKNVENTHPYLPPSQERKISGKWFFLVEWLIMAVEMVKCGNAISMGQNSLVIVRSYWF